MKYAQGKHKGYQLNVTDRFCSAFPQGFRSLVHANRLSPKTVQVIERIVTRQNWSASDLYSNSNPWEDACYRDFREACPALNIPSGPNGPALEKLICLALIRYCLNRVILDRPRACVYHTLSIELLDTLPQAVPSSDAMEREALLWVYNMAIDCWAVSYQAITPEATFLMQEMAVKFPDTLDWNIDDFNAFGRRYLWTENISGILRQYYVKA